jgi:hypothetical protein
MSLTDCIGFLPTDGQACDAVQWWPFALFAASSLPLVPIFAKAGRFSP